MSPSPQFLDQFAARTRLVAWVILWSFLTTGSVPALRAGTPQPIEIKVSPGRVAHQFGIRTYTTQEPLLPVTSEALISNTSTAGGYTSLSTNWDITKTFTLSDLTAGETVTANVSSGSPTSVDLSTSTGWSDTNGNKKQYFLLPENRPTNNLYLAQTGGVWFPLTVSPSLYTSSEGIVFREAVAKYYSAASYWVEDYSRNERTPDGKTNLLDATWSPISSPRIYTVTIYLEPQNLGREFLFHSRSSGSGVRSVSTTATVANNGQSFWAQDVNRGWIQLPAGTVQVTGSVGPRMEYWLSRVGSADVETPHFFAPAPSVTSIAASSVFGVFPKPGRVLTNVSFRFPANTGKYTVEHANGYGAPIQVEYTGWLYSYDDWGNVSGSVEYSVGSAWVDNMESWHVQRDNGTSSYGSATDLLEWYPSYTNPPFQTPNTTATAAISLDRNNHLLSVRQLDDSGAEVTVYSFYPQQWGYENWSLAEFWNGFYNVPVYVGGYYEYAEEYSAEGVSCTVPVFSVSFPCFSDRPFRLVDENTGEIARSDFNIWSTGTSTKEFQISTSRSAHNLYIERLTGSSAKIQELQTQGQLTLSDNGGVSFSSYYYFDATAPHWDSIPFRIVDRDTGEKTNWNPTDEDLVRWISLPALSGLTASLTSSNAVKLSWPLATASRDGSFLIERRVGDDTNWLQIGELPAANAVGSPATLSYTDRLATPGKANHYRVRYTYGGQLSGASNFVAVTTNPLPTKSDGPPDEGNASSSGIKSPHSTIPDFMNPLKGRYVANQGSTDKTAGGGSIRAYSGFPVVPGDSFSPYIESIPGGSLEIEPYGTMHTEDLVVGDGGEYPAVDTHNHIAYRIRLRLKRPQNASSVKVQEKKDEDGLWIDVPDSDAPETNNTLFLNRLVNAGHRYFYRIVATNGAGKVLTSERYVDVTARFTREYKQQWLGNGKLKNIEVWYHYPKTDSLTYRYLFVNATANSSSPSGFPRSISTVENRTLSALGFDLDGVEHFETDWEPAETERVHPSFAIALPSCVLLPIDARAIGWNSADIEDVMGLGEYLKSADTHRVLQVHPRDSESPSYVQVRFQRALEEMELNTAYSVDYDPTKIQVFRNNVLVTPNRSVPLPSFGVGVPPLVRDQLKVLPVGITESDTNVQIVLRVTDAKGGFDTDSVKIRYSARTPDGSRSDLYRFPIEEASGAKYRKLALNGRPITDDSPQAAGESDHQDEETFIDALTLQLRHSTTDIWAPVPGSDLSLSVRRNLQSEVWNAGEGLQPHTKAYHAFGACWSSNLDAHMRIEIPLSGQGPVVPINAYVTDMDGSVHKFMAVGTKGGIVAGQPGEFFAVPTGGHEHSSYLTSLKLVNENDGRWLFRGPNGTEMLFEFFGTTMVGSGGGGPPQQYVYARPVSVKDRLGNALIYEYETAGNIARPIPKRIYLYSDPSRAIQIKCDADNYVTQVWDLNGNCWTYEYYEGSSAIGNPSGLGFAKALKQIKDPLGAVKVSYGYQITEEADNRPFRRSDEPGFPNFHCNLTKITNGRGNWHGFEYDWDVSRADQFTRSTVVGGTLQFGSPRVIKKVSLPDRTSSATFKQNATPVSIAYTYKANVIHTATTTFGAFVPTVVGTRTTEIKDAEDKIVTYSFLDPEVTQETGIQPFSDAGVLKIEPTSLGKGPRLVAYKRMEIKSPLFPVPEIFEFDPQAGMALKKVTDLNGHTTQYVYGDATPDRAKAFGYNWVYGDDGQFWALLTPNFTRFSKPTAEIHAPKAGTSGPTTTTLFKYLIRNEPNTPVPLHLLQQITSPEGRVTEYHFDSVGRRYREVAGKKVMAGVPATDWNNAPDDVVTGAQVTKLAYTNLKYPGVVTAKTILRQSGDPTWAQNLVTTYTHDDHGNVRSEKSGDLTTWYSYDPAGNKLSVTNPQGHRTSFSYDCRNQLIEIGYPYDPVTEGPAPSGSTVTSPVRKTFTYDEAGNKQTETDERGFTTVFLYDPFNRVLEEYRPTLTSAAGALVYANTSHAYNKVGSRTLTTDPLGLQTKFNYDGVQRLLDVTVGYTLGATLERKTTYDYTGTNAGGSIFTGFKPTTITDPRGYKKIITYDYLYRATQESIQYRKAGEEGGLAEAWANTSRTYDNDGNIKNETDAASKLTVYYYDALNRVYKKAFADQTYTTTDYTGTGLAWRVTDELRRATTTQYDHLGRAIKVTSPPVPTETVPTGSTTPTLIPVVTEMEYDLAGNLFRKKDGNGAVWEYYYNPRKLKVAEVHPAVPRMDGGRTVLDQPVLAWEYDKAGNVIAATDARGYTSTTEYTPSNRPEKVTGPWVRKRSDTGAVQWVQPITTTVYDENGNILRITDPELKLTENQYDIFNQLEWTRDANNITVQYSYDKSGNRTHVKDGKLNTTQFAYDGLNRNTKVTYPIGNPLTYQYDGVNKTARIDGKSVLTRYTYDARHRLDKVFYGSSTTAAYDYDYNTVGQLTKVQEPRRAPAASAFTVEYDYDALGRVTEELSQGVRHRYYYDAAGRQRSIVYGGTNRRVDKTYDALGRLTNLTDRPSPTATTGTRVTNFRHDLSGNVVWQKQPDFEEIVRRYDGLGRVELISSTRGTSVLIARTEQFYDLAGNLCWMEERRGVGSGVWDRNVEMKYDSGYRLEKEITRSPTHGQITSQPSYGYDAAGNRTTFDPWTDVPQSYGYNALNQLIWWQDSMESFHTFAYDENGNRSRYSGPYGDVYYTYDEENRLVEVSRQPIGTATAVSEHRYSYDYRSRRIARDEYLNTAPRQTRVIFSGGVSYSEIEGSSTSAAVEYLRGPDMGGGVGGLLYSIRPGNNLRFNHYNARGDVITQTDNAGAVRWAANYEAFGTHTDGSLLNPDRQRANTKEEDPTGLLNEGFRYRDLTTGVFLTRDPAGFVDGPNLYTYVRQNPWSKFDPEGLYGWQLYNPGAPDKYQMTNPEYRRGYMLGAGVAARAIGYVARDMIPGVGEYHDYVDAQNAPEGSREQARSYASMVIGIPFGLLLPNRSGIRSALRVVADSAEADLVRGSKRAVGSTIIENAENGARREREVAKELAEENPGKVVQNERTLRDAEGNKVIDPVTGEGRRVDHAVIDREAGTAKTYETTGNNVDKKLQLEKEARIREQGGTYIRDKETRKLVQTEGVSEVRRQP